MSDNFPAWYYGPNGESQVFHRLAHVPEGWADAPIPGVSYDKTQSTGEAAAVSDLNGALKAAEARADKAEAKVEELSDALKATKDQIVGYQVQLQEANARGDLAVEAAGKEVADLKAAHAAEIAAFQKDVAELKAKAAKPAEAPAKK